MGVGKKLITEACSWEKHGELFIFDGWGKTDFWGGDDLPSSELQIGAVRVENIAVVEGLAIDRRKEPGVWCFLRHDFHLPHVFR